MTYIPVGTYLTYTATVQPYLTKGFTSWSELASKLSNDLRNELPGQEELDVTSSNGSNNYLQFNFNISLQVLNNGVDHGDENDVKSLIDGVIQGYGNNVVSSSITKIQLPNNPDDGTAEVINTGANSNAPPPTNTTSSSSGKGLFSGFSLGGASIAGISITTIVIVLIIAVLLLPGNARRLIGAR